LVGPRPYLKSTTAGDSEQDIVGSAGMLAEPIRLHYVILSHDFRIKGVTRLIVDMESNIKVDELSKAVSRL